MGKKTGTRIGMGGLCSNFERKCKQMDVIGWDW